MANETQSHSAPDGAKVDAEVASARLVFRELDKTWRAARTYGLDNAVTTRFFGQLHDAMTHHLEEFNLLGVVVERAELHLSDQIVHQGEDTQGESLAFRLSGDGVRELRFQQGVSAEDLRAFVDALSGQDDSPDADEDVVTRLWAKDLATITFVTAEDIMQAPWLSSELIPQESGFFAAPPASFEGLLDRERRSLGAPAVGGPTSGPAAAGENLPRRGGLVGFEVTDVEREALARELDSERALDAARYLLHALRAILLSELSPDLLTRALAILPGALEVQLRAGSWSAIVEICSMLYGAVANPAFGPTHRVLSQRVVESLSLPQRVALIETALNADPARPVLALGGVLSRLQPSAAGALCTVLSNLASADHRAIVREALIELAKNNQEPVLKGIADPRPQYVSDLIRIIAAWKQPQAVAVLATLAPYPSAAVRRDAIASIASLRPRGDGAALVAFASDPDREVRLEALRFLAGGQYTAVWQDWRLHLEGEALADQSRADKRALFHALRATAGEAAVPFWQSLLSEKGWKNRHKKEETALLAVQALAALGTPRALEALEAGRQGASSAVRKACAAALSSSSKGK